MKKLLFLVAGVAMSLGAIAATPASASACTTGETRYVVEGSFLGTFFGYNEYRVVEQVCGGYTWKTVSVS